MQIREIDVNDKTDIRRFVYFPFELYRNHPLWSPPFVSGMFSALDPNGHPSRKHIDAAFFIAESDGQVIARVAAVHNHRHSEFTGKETAFFSFFEAYDDSRATQMLFEAAFAWMRARGLIKVIGPRGLVGSDAGGVLVDGFAHPPAMNVPWNYDYYDRLIKAAGFVKDTQHYSGYIDLTTYQFPERVLEMLEKLKKRSSLSVKSFTNKKELLTWAPRALNVHRRAFINNHEYYPPTEQESAMIIDDLMLVADPHLIKMAVQDDEVIGFILAYPDINNGIRRAKGRIWPFGWVHIYREKHRTRWVDVNGLGILPEKRGLGCNALLYMELLKSLKERGFEHLEAVMVDENNYRSKSDNLTMGVNFYKTHRCYTLKLA